MPVVYPVVLGVHSYWRWVVLAAAVMVLVRAWQGWRSRRPWTPVDDRASRFFVVTFDMQVLIGLFLYVALSPLTRAAFGNFGAAMGDSVMRFWAVEHIFGMLVAAAFVHIGRAKTRRPSTRDRHKTAVIFYGLALVAMLLTIPWPFMPAGRPLFW
jgi:hypothetical protein